MKIKNTHLFAKEGKEQKHRLKNTNTLSNTLSDIYFWLKSLCKLKIKIKMCFRQKKEFKKMIFFGIIGEGGFKFLFEM